MNRDERERRLRLSELAEHAPAVLQVWEATGGPPPLKGASWARFRLETAFGSDTKAGWQKKYLKAVAAFLPEPTVPAHVTPRPVAAPAPPPPAASGRTTSPPPPAARRVRAAAASTTRGPVCAASRPPLRGTERS